MCVTESIESYMRSRTRSLLLSWSRSVIGVKSISATNVSLDPDRLFCHENRPLGRPPLGWLPLAGPGFSGNFCFYGVDFSAGQGVEFV